MGYEFKNTESVAANIKRILNEELSASIQALENAGSNQEETVHGVRKRIKKIRALFRLIRNNIGDEIFGQENIRYRNIGHTLSHLRDATVMIKTLDKLKETYKSAIPKISFIKARQALVQTQAQVSKEFFEEKSNLRQVINAFTEARQQGTELPIKTDSFEVFAANMQGIYKRGKKTYSFAHAHPSIDSFHELRKEVKHIWYHTRLLNPVWPEIFQAFSQQLELLSELLGNDHDMGVLTIEIESGKLTFARKATAAKIISLIHIYRENLQQQIYPLAQRVFAERAEDFVKRYRTYWDIWRTERELEKDIQKDSSTD